MKIQLLVDGKPVAFLNDVRVIVELEDNDNHLVQSDNLDGPEHDGVYPEALYLVLTPEGLVQDLLYQDYVIATGSETYDEMVEQLISSNWVGWEDDDEEIDAALDAEDSPKPSP